MSKQDITLPLTCVLCPRGCELLVQSGNGKIEVTGNQCEKGIQYGHQEMSDPHRILTTTVQTAFPDFPRLSVKTHDEIPLREVFRFMQSINEIMVNERKKIGDIIAENILNSGINLIATDDMITGFEE